MSLFARTGSRVRSRSRSRRSARSSTSSWKSRQSTASLSGSFYGNKDLRRSASTRSRTSYPGKRSASFHDVHVSRSRSATTRKSFAGRPSETYTTGTTSSLKCPDPRARNSYSGTSITVTGNSNHLTLRPRNSYSGNTSPFSYNEGKDIRRSSSQRSARSSVGFEPDIEGTDTSMRNFRRSSSRRSSHSYAGVMHLNNEERHIIRSSSQKSARSYAAFSNDLRQFQRSCSERSTRSRRSDTLCFYLNGADHQMTSRRRHSRRFDDDAIWDRTPRLSRRSRCSLPGEVTGFFNASPSWVRKSRNRSVGSIGLYGSLLCVDLNTSVFDDVIDDVKAEKHCESYLSPECTCHETELSFDDERQLVRTTVGWNPRTGEENQPDYGAFSYQLHEAGKESENVIEFACKTSNIICNTLLVTVLVGLSMTMPISMVSMGVKYLDDCPKEPRVPIYLLVGGCFGMIKLLSTLWRNIQARRYQDIELVFDDNDDADGAFASTTYRTMDAILFLFLVGWQVAGTYWTLEIWKPLFKQKLHEPSNWCDETVYMFTVYQIFACYGAMVVYLLVLILLTCCYRCCKCRRI